MRLICHHYTRKQCGISHTVYIFYTYLNRRLRMQGLLVLLHVPQHYRFWATVGCLSAIISTAI